MAATPDAQRATLTGGLDRFPAPRSTSPSWAGIAGPVLFTAAFLAQETFRRGDIDPVSEPVSALETGPNGWIQQANFVVFGVLTLVFAVGLHRGMRRSRAGIAGPAALAVSGAALVLAAIFPLQRDAYGELLFPVGHTVSGAVFFGTSAIGLVLVSLRAAKDPRWRGIARYTLVAGGVAVASFVFNGTLIVPDDAPLHGWAGLVQRGLILLVLFPARIALSYRLLQVTRAAHLTR